MQVLSKHHNMVEFLLSIIDIYRKYAWVVLLKDKKGIAITSAFQKLLDKSDRNQLRYRHIGMVSFTIG